MEPQSDNQAGMSPWKTSPSVLPLTRATYEGFSCALNTLQTHTHRCDCPKIPAMSFQDESPDERRVSSFRIDDILADRGLESSKKRRLNVCSASNPPVSPQQDLSFGVEQILMRQEKRHDERELCYMGSSFAGVSSAAHASCPHLNPSVWCTPYLHPYLYSSLHAGCEACYSHGSLSYSNDAFAALYNDCNASILSKSQLASQALAGQPKPRKPRRPWTRAVFSNLQRKGLEKRFQVQKYLTKADRHQLASMLGLSDNQVKVWFQNRRMKWRQEARESVATGSSEESEKQQPPRNGSTK